MERTLIAVFDNRGDAESALDELLVAGFTRQQVYLSDADPTGAPGADQAASDGSIVGSIKHFLSNMFGTDNSEHVQKYSDAVTRGHQVLTLRVAHEREVGRAADIIERWGPVDIDEKSAQWGGGAADIGALRAGSGVRQQAASMSQQSMQGTAGSAQGGLEVEGAAAGQGQPGSQQKAPGMEGSGGIGSGSGGSGNIPLAQRSGVRVFEHLAQPSPETSAAAADEAYFRSHYTSNYAGNGAGEQYDDYAPAYQYGVRMASSEQYRGRAWREAEPQLRSAWEGRYPGSAWSKFKAAVHHGWDKITG